MLQSTHSLSCKYKLLRKFVSFPNSKARSASTRSPTVAHFFLTKKYVKMFPDVKRFRCFCKNSRAYGATLTGFMGQVGRPALATTPPAPATTLSSRVHWNEQIIPPRSSKFNPTYS